MMFPALLMALVTGCQTAPKTDAAKRDLDTEVKIAIMRFEENDPGLEEFFKTAHGYAVFSSIKVALGVSGGGGTGVAVNKESKERTYMKMGTAGIGFGLGGRKYQIVFLFEDSQTFDKFVDKGWQADTSANATAGTASAGVESSFTNGLAIFVLTEKGLMASAEVAGTKYWKNDKLN